MKKVSNMLLIGIFMLIITVPYLFAHRDFEERVSDTENRMLAAYPRILDDNTKKFNSNYIKEFESWLSDNLRGRTILVEMNAGIQYQLFHRIVKNDTIEGKNHWLFINSEEMFQEYQHLNLLDEDSLELVVDNLQGLSEYLKEKGVTFYYFQCLDKESIYPQEYIEGIHQIGECSRAEQLINELQRKTDIPVIFPQKELQEKAKKDLIYYQYVDLEHWNEKGAYIGYRALLDRIREDYEKAEVLELDDYNQLKIEKTTDIYGYTYPYSEICPVYEVKNPAAIEKTEEIMGIWDYLVYKEHTYYYENNQIDSDLKILVIGDSFIRMFLKDDIAEGFSETLSIDWMNLPLLDKIVQDFQPDIVVLESTESTLGTVIEYLDQMEFVK